MPLGGDHSPQRAAGEEAASPRSSLPAPRTCRAVQGFCESAACASAGRELQKKATLRPGQVSEPPAPGEGNERRLAGLWRSIQGEAAEVPAGDLGSHAPDMIIFMPSRAIPSKAIPLRSIF